MAYRDERVPWYAKLFTMLVVAYAFSPIDLIPDFIPILGYLDDLILVPLGVYLALKLIPKEVLEDCKRKVEERQITSKPKNWITGIIIITLWILVFVWAVKIANLINFQDERIKKATEYIQLDMEVLMSSLQTGQTYGISDAYVGMTDKVLTRMIFIN